MASASRYSKIQMKTDPTANKAFRSLAIDYEMDHKRLFTLMVTTFDRVIRTTYSPQELSEEELLKFATSVEEQMGVDHDDLIPPMPREA